MSNLEIFSSVVLCCMYISMCFILEQTKKDTLRIDKFLGIISLIAFPLFIIILLEYNTPKERVYGAIIGLTIALLLFAYRGR